MMSSTGVEGGISPLWDQLWEQLSEQLESLPTLLTAHLGLSLAALLCGIAVSVPLGIWVHRHPRWETPVLGVAGVMQTLPGLALLAFMVPALAALGLKSIGVLPALIGLFLYSLLPILRNTVTGLRELDPAMREAALGVGMTPTESLWRVELPLVLPVMVAGIRISAVWTVGTATLSTPVGAPGLGNYIFGGLQTRNYVAVLVGCVASAGLALVFDGLIRLLARGLEQRRRRLLQGAGLGLVVLSVVGLAPFFAGLGGLTGGSSGGSVASSAQQGTQEGAPVVVGAKTFSESYILAHLLAEQVSRKAGASVQVLESLGSTVVFDALASGQVDAYVDYSGTLWSAVLKRGEPRPSRLALVQELGRALAAEYGIHLVASLGFENTYALAMREADAQAGGVRSLDGLGPLAGRLRVGGDYEIFQRPEWKAVTGAYGLRFAEQRSMDPSLMYEAIRAGEVDLISAYSTDGRIQGYKLRVLADPKGAIPPYDAVVLVSRRLWETRPEVVEALKSLEQRVSAEVMRELNQKVDAGGMSPKEAARSFVATLK
ncbi:MAG: ABC transporter permease/substrate-binding protein [Myxococcota bacterium]